MAVVLSIGPNGAPGPARTAPPSPSVPAVSSAPNRWGGIQVIPLTGLGAAGGARIDALVCASLGNCTAGGSYADRLGHRQIFVVSQVNGTWGKPVPIPGLTGISGGTGAAVLSMSCPAADDCVAAGRYDDRQGQPRPFIAESKDGVWAGPVPLTFGRVILKPGPVFEASSVSCATSDNCSAGLTVPVSAPAAASGVAEEAYVADEVNGTWQAARPVPGLAGLNAGFNAGVSSLNCFSPGSCLAGGWYTRGVRHAFVATETHGVWGRGMRLPGLSRLAGFNSGSSAVVSSVSCASAEDCAAAGTYFDVTFRGFAAEEINGKWTTRTISDARDPGASVITTVSGVSCDAPDSCTVVGTFDDRSGSRAFVWSASDGVREITGINGEVEADVLACAARHCVVSGTAQAPSGQVQAFVADGTAGGWSAAQPVGSLPVGASPAVLAASCAAPGDCAIGGVYVDSETAQAFVAEDAISAG